MKMLVYNEGIVNQTLRTFIAVSISQEKRNLIADYQRQLKSLGGDVRWVRPEGIHITLKFLGDVPGSKTGEIEKNLRTVVQGLNPFSVSLEGCGGFPNLRKPRVLWIGIKEGAEQLSRLAEDIDHLLHQIGFEKEKRSYSAHLTLGRVRSPQNMDKIIETMLTKPFQGGQFSVDSIHLMKSDLRPSGAVYAQLATIKFEG
jgi:2'-5' RNA ligase